VYKNIQLILIKTASTIYEKLIRKTMPLSLKANLILLKQILPFRGWGHL